MLATRSGLACPALLVLSPAGPFQILQGIIRSFRQAAQLAVGRVRELAVDIGGKDREVRLLGCWFCCMKRRGLAAGAACANWRSTWAARARRCVLMRV